jgi:hypothetical protein
MRRMAKGEGRAEREDGWRAMGERRAVADENDVRGNDERRKMVNEERESGRKAGGEARDGRQTRAAGGGWRVAGVGERGRKERRGRWTTTAEMGNAGAHRVREWRFSL